MVNQRKRGSWVGPSTFTFTNVYDNYQNIHPEAPTARPALPDPFQERTSLLILERLGDALRSYGASRIGETSSHRRSVRHWDT